MTKHIEKKFKYIIPKDAGVLILLDTSKETPRILMGKRNNSLTFMPGKHVFPGGRVERSDSFFAGGSALNVRDATRMSHRLTGRSGAHRSGLTQTVNNRLKSLALAAIRETFEETGYLVGTAQRTVRTHIPDIWKVFCKEGVEPDLSQLYFIARAVTPPNLAKRYDTRFFLVCASHIKKEVPLRDKEFTHLDWLSFSQAQAVDLPRITRAILEDVRFRLNTGTAFCRNRPVPYYDMGNQGLNKDFID